MQTFILCLRWTHTHTRAIWVHPRLQLAARIAAGLRACLYYKSLVADRVTADMLDIMTGWQKIIQICFKKNLQRDTVFVFFFVFPPGSPFPPPAVHLWLHPHLRCLRLTSYLVMRVNFNLRGTAEQKEMSSSLRVSTGKLNQLP